MDILVIFSFLTATNPSKAAAVLLRRAEITKWRQEHVARTYCSDPLISWITKKRSSTHKLNFRTNIKYRKHFILINTWIFLSHEKVMNKTEQLNRTEQN